MFSKTNQIFLTAVSAALSACALGAAPKLTLSPAVLPTIAVAQGANGSVALDAKNIGDGTLNLKATGSAPWIVPTVGATHACTDGSGPSCLPVQVALQTSALARGAYVGFVSVNDPNAINAPAIATVSVQIGAGVPDKIEFYVPVGGSASIEFQSPEIVVSAAASDPAATWLSIAQDGGSPFSPTLPYKVGANAGALATGDYTGSISIRATIGGTVTKTIPVTLHVVTQPITGPLSNIGGALNNTTYTPGESLAQGDIVALFGSQFLTGSPVAASSLPLSTTLGGLQVFLNDQPVPVYYASVGQINFQVPFNAQIGDGTLRVDSNGMRGNTIAINIAKSVPRLLRLNGNFGDYGIVTNPNNSLAIPSALGGIPAKVGAALVIYAIGFGPTSPSVDSGAGSPSAEPLARLANHPKVCFSSPTPFNPGICVDPLFAGLSPGFVGLYQINVVIPQGAPTGDIVPVTITTDDGTSNTIYIAVQQ